MKLLLFGYSDIAQRRVLPAVERLTEIEAVEVVSTHAVQSNVVGRFEKVVASYTSPIEALAQSNADIVYVSGANDTHFFLAEKALLSGKHVVVDKPITLSISHTMQLAELAQRNGLLLAEALVYPFHPIVSQLADAFRSLGDEPKHVSALFSMTLEKPGNYRWQLERGGGCLWDLGPYAVSLGRILYQEFPTSVRGVVLSRNESVGVDTAFSILLQYSSGRTVNGLFSWAAAYRNEIHCIGKRSSASVERVFTTPPEFSAEIDLHVEESGQTARNLILVRPADSFYEFLCRAVQSIKGRNFASFREALLLDSKALDMLRSACLG